MSQAFSVIGRRLPRLDGAEKATGAAKYIGDLQLPGMLIGKVLMSPYPHAKILSIDTSKAERLAGVEAVITASDVPKKAFNMGVYYDEMLSPHLRGVPKDQHIFSDKARFVGDAIAAVAAINESIAEEALKLIEVEYEPLPAVFDPLEAMKPGAPRIHDFAKNNIADHLPFTFGMGDVETGFKEADYIVEETFRTTKQKHCQLEPTACIASFDITGRLTIWSACQQPHPARGRIAEIFDIPEGRIRWLTPVSGGSFGLRQSLTNEPICVALAQKAGKPVKLEDTREEDFIARESRQPVILTGKVGVKKDGTITALQTKLIADAGAYYTQSDATTFNAMRRFMGLYRCRNTAGEADIVYTNTPISGGMRGYGNPKGTFAREQLMDMAAEKIGIHPLEFRLKNIKRAGEPSSYPAIPIDSCALDECIQLGAERIGWQKKRAERKQGVRRRGVGMACAGHNSGAYPSVLQHSNAYVKLNADGSANLVVALCEMGQGILGVLAQIAAEELGLKAEDVHVVDVDTDISMFDSGNFSSRGTYMTGNAVLRAAREAKNQLLERAAKALGVSVAELSARDGRIYIKAAPEKGISIAEIARNAIYNFQGECLNISGRCSFEPQESPNTFQTVFAEVEVDTETGEVKVIKIVVAVDIGIAINPMAVEGQLEGAALQGIGYALTEDFVVDADSGVTITDNFVTYKIPSAADLPEIEVILIEHPSASGPFGAKGVGELGLIAVAPAIANAIYDATRVRITELPITPEKILKAMQATKAVA